MQKQFIERVQACEGLINKILFLYTDREEERKDLRQEILSEAWRSYSGFREDAKFSTWLYRVGLNVAITSLHKRKRHPNLNLSIRNQNRHGPKRVIRMNCSIRYWSC